MMGYTGRIELGLWKFNRLFGYEIFWVLINDKLMQKAIPYGDAGWRLTDDTSSESV